MKLREDRWLIAGQTWQEGKRLRGWLAARCGTVPAGFAPVPESRAYGRKN